MKIKEWIEVARHKLDEASVTDWRFNNLKTIGEIRKILNEIEILVDKETNP